ncbi:hypothetical protein PCK2_000392, partial [Pneumocystis canis]
YSGITEEKLSNVTTKITDVQKALLKLIDENTIIVGHSLEWDFRSLKFAHPYIIDTSFIFQHTRGPPYKPGLKWLAHKWLKREIQKNNLLGHDSIEDALTCIDLFKLKLKNGPEFGLFNTDNESIFSKLEKCDETKKCAIVDYGGESNSCLIVGPKSSGKSNILDTAIMSLNEFSSHFFVVRLNGIIQTDDKLALKEIARQLNVKMNLDDQENITSNFSDNLFKILTILSHPKELDLINDEKTSEEFDTYYDPLSSNNITSVSVIFILDNFDLFTQHYRQTLLYNLFDISQTRKAPIAVIGLTCVLDSVEALEKRVKSRFSHRIIQIKYPDNLELFIKICRAGLTIDCELSSELSLKEKESLFVKNWDRHIDGLFEEGNLVYQLVKGIFMISKDVREFYSHCIVPVISLSPSSPELQESLFLSQDLFHSSAKTELLNGKG